MQDHAENICIACDVGILWGILDNSLKTDLCFAREF